MADAEALVRELRYDKMRKLGEGGMGMAYRARCLTDGSMRVLKINRNAHDKGAEEELLDEGKRLQSLLGGSIILGKHFQVGRNFLWPVPGCVTLTSLHCMSWTPARTEWLTSTWSTAGAVTCTIESRSGFELVVSILCHVCLVAFLICEWIVI